MSRSTEKIICLKDDITVKIDESEISFTIGARDFKGPITVAIIEEQEQCTNQECSPAMEEMKRLKH